MLAWTGPDGYKHRLKLCVLRDALATLRGHVALVDTDTYFLRSPMQLFRRIGPGQSVLHRKEGHLDKWNATPLADHLASTPAPLSLDGRRWNCTADRPMGNSGVLGLHPKDATLADEILLDQLLQPVRFHGTEQFAAGVVLMERTRLSESADIVFHCWLMDSRLPFRALLNEAFEHGLPDDEVYRRVLPHQRVDPPIEIVKLRVQRLLEALGLYRERRR
jgi:hypothetical protein